MLRLVCLLAVLVGLILPATSHARNANPTARLAQSAQEIAKRMSVAEKVGQLFVVNFAGTDVTTTSDIADLIVNEHIGGVLLSATHNNYTNSAQLPQQVAQLTNNLQGLAAMTLTNDTTPKTDFVPLFIAVANDGSGALHNESTQGLTAIPTQLALGATWQPENAAIVGRIVGEEMAQLGVNVLLGPNLDVVDTPKPNAPGDAGTRVFGGDPFWVSKLGVAFVNGLHKGSDNRIAVVAKNFPGLGSADRNIEDEIPTVQKSLEQLKQIELTPFFGVTQGAAQNPNMVEGLLVSHIRFRGFQGNIRASTRPVSLDPQAYLALMSLPELSAWRNSGGVTFSDVLGIRSVRRFYDPLDKTFNGRRIAQEALVAGNDVLLLGNFGLSADMREQTVNIKDTLAFFRAKYTDDKTFSARVDEALIRILSLKLKLYGGGFSVQSSQVDLDAVAQIKPNNEAIAAIAKDSITLLYPSTRDLPAVIPAPPSQNESVVFITDDRVIQECETCLAYAAIPKTALQDIALELYGPEKTGQLDPQRISSFSFSDLALLKSGLVSETQTAAATTVPTPSILLDVTQTPTATATSTQTLPNRQTPLPKINSLALVTATQATTVSVQQAIENAQWIVISMLDLNPNISSTAILREFLSQRADALRDKRVIVFAFSAPYYLDATEVSKVTAYFGAYSRTNEYLRAAVQSLFLGFAVKGASPVSVDAVGYTLVDQTQPDANQLIPMSVSGAISDTARAAPLERKVGDKLTLRAGPVYDSNGRIVPDNTQVQFVISYPNERLEQPQQPVSTFEGFAETTLLIERKGVIEIRAIAEPAQRSYVIRVNIPENNDTVSIETIKPTAFPTTTPAPTLAPTNTAVPQPTPAQTPATTGGTSVPNNWLGFLVTLLVLGLVSLMGYGAMHNLSLIARWRAVALSWLAGWLAYSIYALGNPTLSANALGWVGLPVISGLCTALVLAVFVVGSRQQTN